MPAENAGRAFALVLVDELVAHGVRHAVISPGSRSTPIALALLENPHIAVHVRIDERSAAYVALGIAKTSGQVVPVLCTSGTATSYFHGAVMEADLSRIPLLVLTADRPPELHGIGANQTVEQTGLYSDAVRWAPDVPVPASAPGAVGEWRALVSEAVAHCHGSRDAPPGPVHLNLPLREPLIPVDDGTGFPFDLDLGAVPPEDAEGDFDDRGISESSAELLGWLDGASTGVIVAGGGAPRPEVEVFADRSGWPVIAEPHSNLRRGDLALRSTDALLRDDRFTSEHRPDVVVVFGRVGLSRALLSWLATVPHIIVSTDGGNWDVTRTARAVVHCDATAVAGTALHLSPAATSWARAWHDASTTASEAIDQILDASPTLTEPQVARDAAAMVPSETLLVVASSMPIRDLDLVMRPRQLRILANRGVSGIDGFVSTAMGVALGRLVEGPTVALCGDLSLLHDINGLMPGPDPRPDVTFVVINNDGGGIFSLLPQAASIHTDSFERLFGTPHRMSIEKVAAAYEVEHTLVGTTDELAAALSDFGALRIIEVRTDRAANAALHTRLRAVSVSTA
jgi:2-succinyl-5-enolpyruvyl-6-hydroxy-3-cyclohexene-1-carboxylate synthase